MANAGAGGRQRPASAARTASLRCSRGSAAAALLLEPPRAELPAADQASQEPSCAADAAGVGRSWPRTPGRVRSAHRGQPVRARCRRRAGRRAGLSEVEYSRRACRRNGSRRLSCLQGRAQGGHGEGGVASDRAAGSLQIADGRCRGLRRRQVGVVADAGWPHAGGPAGGGARARRQALQQDQRAVLGAGRVRQGLCAGSGPRCGATTPTGSRLTTRACRRYAAPCRRQEARCQPPCMATKESCTTSSGRRRVQPHQQRHPAARQSPVVPQRMRLGGGRRSALAVPRAPLKRP